MKKNLKELNPELEPGDRIMLLHMDEESVPVGSIGVVKKKVNQPKFKPADPGYGYFVEWYDRDTNELISKLTLLPEVDAWVFDKDFYKQENK